MFTSKTHPLRIDVIDLSCVKGQIGLTLCPGKYQPEAMSGAWNRDLDADLEVIRRWAPSYMLTLVQQFELRDLRVTALPEKAQRLGIQWLHLPIVDHCCPDEAFEARWREVSPNLHKSLAEGHRILVHCKGGLGRAGTVAGRLLLEMGEHEDADSAIRHVRTARRRAIDTVQEDYLRCLAAQLQASRQQDTMEGAPR